MRVNNSSLKNLPQITKNRCSNKNLYTGIHSGIIHTPQRMETR